jgi:phosphoserine phosphatase
MPKACELPPGTKQAFALLRRIGIKTALVSITWSFVVEWLGAELGADYAVGTGWLDTDEVADFWPNDKATWLITLLTQLSASPDDLVAGAGTFLC